MLLAQAEHFLNRCINESTRAQECRDRLRGRSLGLTISGLPFGVTLSIDGEDLHVAAGIGADVDVRVETGLIEAFTLLEADSVEALRRADASIKGDLKVADDYSELLRHARPDIEGELARYIGDIPAHALANIVRTAVKRSGDARRSCERNVAEYLKSEVRVLAQPLELARFGREVERMRDDVARLEQRFARLAPKLNSRTE